MGREVRRVPADWQHPRTSDGRYRPMYDQSFAEMAAEWKVAYAAWESGADPDRAEHPEYEYWEWNGDPPDRDYYRPDWTDEERTHFQMYECTSEGTPISPVMESPEALARWLVENNASAFAGETATYEQWLRVCNGGWAPTAIGSPGQELVSGVAGLTESTPSPKGAE